MRDRTGFIARVHPRRRVAALPLALAIAGSWVEGSRRPTTRSGRSIAEPPASSRSMVTCHSTRPSIALSLGPGPSCSRARRTFFHAYSNSHFGIVKNPTSRDGLITCILTSEGPMFDPPWTLVGKLAP